MRSDPVGAARLAPQISQLHRKLFARLDSDRDNRISFGEMRDSGILRKVGAARTDADERAAFDKADTNHDGVLSRGESFELFNGLMQGSGMVLALITMLVGANEDPAVTEGEGEAAEAKDANKTAETRIAAYGDAAAALPSPRLDVSA